MYDGATAIPAESQLRLLSIVVSFETLVVRWRNAQRGLEETVGVDVGPWLGQGNLAMPTNGCFNAAMPLQTLEPQGSWGWQFAL